MEQRTVGVGVIGLGFMGHTHLNAFKRCPNAQVVAVADREEARLSGEAGAEGNFETGSGEVAFDPAEVATFTDAADLLGHPLVELVSITTPTPTHQALAKMVIDAGKHLLLEKPVDLDPAVITDLAERAGSKGVLVMPAHCMRFWPAWAWMKGHLDTETYGRPKRASFRRLGAAPTWNLDFYLDEEKSGGAIVDLHIHDVDFIVHCFGVPRGVSSEGSRRHVKTTYDFGPEGPIVEAEGGWLEDDSPFTMECDIECDHGTMSFELGRDPELIVSSKTTTTTHPEASDGGTGYDGEVSAIVQAILANAEAPPVTLHDAAVVARVINGEIESLRTTRPFEFR